MHSRYAARRAALLEQITDGPLLIRGADAPENLRYLTGFDEPRAALLLSARGVRIERGRPGPDYLLGRTAREVLFVPPSDPRAARWGEDASVTLGSVEATDLSLDALIDARQLPAVLERALQRDGVLHQVRRALPTLTGGRPSGSDFAADIRERFVGLRLHDATPIVHGLRRLKDSDEVAAIRRAVDVTAEAFVAARAAIEPGCREADVEAEIVRVYRRHGANHAFDPIVGAGANALVLHYVTNDGPIEPDCALLIDSGARLDGYCADISRTYPTSRRFTERQREIYAVVLEAQLRAIDACRPGRTLSNVHRAAWDVIDAAGHGGAFIHGTSHHLGLETHDVGDIEQPLEPGAVVTVEPGIYLPDEMIGVRIEDDVLVTDTEPDVLSGAIPKSLDEIEAPR